MPFCAAFSMTSASDIMKINDSRRTARPPCPSAMPMKRESAGRAPSVHGITRDAATLAMQSQSCACDEAAGADFGDSLGVLAAGFSLSMAHAGRTLLGSRSSQPLFFSMGPSGVR